jgi:hypothetical protein
MNGNPRDTLPFWFIADETQGTFPDKENCTDDFSGSAAYGSTAFFGVRRFQTDGAAAEQGEGSGTADAAGN